MFFVFNSVPDRYKTQQLRDRVTSENPFMLKFCLDRYKTYEMCDEAVDDCLSAIKFIPGWFVADKMIRKVHEALFTNDDIFFFDAYSGNATFSSDKKGYS